MQTLINKRAHSQSSYSIRTRRDANERRLNPSYVIRSKIKNKFMINTYRQAMEKFYCCQFILFLFSLHMINKGKPLSSRMS